MGGALASLVNPKWATAYKGNYKVNGRTEATAQEVLPGTFTI